MLPTPYIIGNYSKKYVYATLTQKNNKYNANINIKNKKMLNLLAVSSE
jgi:hypothetical protein